MAAAKKKAPAKKSAKKAAPAKKTKKKAPKLDATLLLVANEMNETMGLDPAIDVTVETDEELQALIMAEVPEIEEGDEFSEEVQAWLDENVTGEDEEPEDEEAEDAEEESEDEEPEEEDDEEPEDEEPDEEPAPKKKGSKKASAKKSSGAKKSDKKAPAKKKAAPKTPAYKRAHSIADAVTKYAGKTVAVDKVVTAAAELYAKKTDSAVNEKESKWIWGSISCALQHLGLLEVKSGKVTINENINISE